MSKVHIHPKAIVFDKGKVLEKRKGFTTVRANYGDEILAACIFCNCPVQEVIKHHAHGSHPDLLVVHRDECPAYEQIQAALKRNF